MRIFVNSDEGGKPFELYSNNGEMPGHVGWYYQVMHRVVDGENNPMFDHGEGNGEPWYEPTDDTPAGPFGSLTMAFKDAIGCNYDINPDVDIAAGALYEETKLK